MNKVTDHPDRQRLQEDLARLKNGDGGGTFGGMEARVAKLEANMEHVQANVTQITADTRDLRDRMSRLEVKVDNLPKKGFIVTSLLVSLALIAGLIGFQTNVQNFFAGEQDGTELTQPTGGADSTGG